MPVDDSRFSLPARLISPRSNRSTLFLLPKLFHTVREERLPSIQRAELLWTIFTRN